MEKVTITFNKEPFNKNYDEENIELQSSFKYNDKIFIKSKIENIEFSDRSDLINLFEKIRGTDVNSLKLKFYERNYNKWANANFYEQQAFKSLVLIYHWLELSLSNPNDLDVRNNLYNEFIVDWNYTPGSQNTIYLISENNVNNDINITLLNQLVKLNLLCKIIVTINKKELQNYFIPPLTPGIPLKYFKSEYDLNGLNTNKLWKNLLKERDLKIKNWVTNRF